ncbi:MAG TPA: hypothetical protein VFM25_03240 [Verrucomicrobiae bacterium]|nr:hypothetical protein [Verrucomicrobiae bacterium]
MKAEPLFIATERFDPSDGETWKKYFDWAKIPALKEVVSLDACLCKHLINEFLDEDWKHNVHDNFRSDYFKDLDYLRQRVQNQKRKNLLGVYRNPDKCIPVTPSNRNFDSIGYDLIEEETQISALTNCGGFPAAFSNEELNSCGLISEFQRASEVRHLLVEKYPEEAHTHCEMYAIWRLDE